MNPSVNKSLKDSQLKISDGQGQTKAQTENDLEAAQGSVNTLKIQKSQISYLNTIQQLEMIN